MSRKNETGGESEVHSEAVHPSEFGGKAAKLYAAIPKARKFNGASANGDLSKTCSRYYRKGLRVSPRGQSNGGWMLAPRGCRSARSELGAETINPFTRPREYRRLMLKSVKISNDLSFNGKGFICALINSRCHIGCEHCMFSSNMGEGRNEFNTMTVERVRKLMRLVKDSNTGYLLVSGGGEGFLEPDLMGLIVEQTTADLTWMVTSGFWANSKERALKVLKKLHGAFTGGMSVNLERKVCIRVSVDSHHVNRLARVRGGAFDYIVNIIKAFESEYPAENNFFLQLHGMEGEESLIKKLMELVGATEVSGVDPIHEGAKVTESAIRVRLESGYEFEVTFAKLLYSDLAADLRDREMLDKRTRVWDRDAFVNMRGQTAFQFNPDGTVGTDMLVIYDGRVAGAWQCEMPDVRINIDDDSFQSILDKTLSDPGVLATLERGLPYRFDVINEVCPRAVIRAKAINIRDYTSPTLLEEDIVKLYFTVRAVQDFIKDGRIQPETVAGWPKELQDLVGLSKSGLRKLFYESRYDIVQQFEETESGFREFFQQVRAYFTHRDSKRFVAELLSRQPRNKRKIDKWRLLIQRIVHDWYDITSLTGDEIEILGEVEKILDVEVLRGQRIYEGLSRFHQ